MAIRGHKTRYVFDRYHIVGERTMRENAEKLETYLSTLNAEVSKNRSRQPVHAVSEKRMIQ